MHWKIHLTDNLPVRLRIQSQLEATEQEYQQTITQQQQQSACIHHVYAEELLCWIRKKKQIKVMKKKKSKLKCRQLSWSDCRPWISLHTTHTHIYYLVGWRRLRCSGCLTANATVTVTRCVVYGAVITAMLAAVGLHLHIYHIGL